jgi:hypothetical protein
MRYRKILILFFLLPLLAGCLNKRPDYHAMNNQIDVFGAQLFSNLDYRDIQGVQGADEPCLRGIDRSFDELDIMIGYGFDKKIRKISTRNKNTSMFGVKPGMLFEEGRSKALLASFEEFSPPFTFRAGDAYLFFLVNNNTIFGLRLELLD